jgi:hypothetical protein
MLTTLLPFQGVAVALPIYFATKRYLFSRGDIHGEWSSYFAAAFRNDFSVEYSYTWFMDKIFLKKVWKCYQFKSMFVRCVIEKNPKWWFIRKKADACYHFHFVMVAHSIMTVPVFVGPFFLCIWYICYRFIFYVTANGRHFIWQQDPVWLSQ